MRHTAWCAGTPSWKGDVREVDVQALRKTLRAQAAVLDGTC